ALEFLREALREAGQHPDRSKSVEESGPSEYAFRPARDVRPLQPASERSLLRVQELASILESGGAFEAQFDEFEHRPQQVAMLKAVADALNNGQHLMIEAPTGVGKSLAYLVPAAHWAVQNGERVIVSTNTINLQEQLYRKDLPDLASVLPFKFNAAVLKGRSHYLCPNLLATVRRRGVRTPEEARVLSKILVWLQDSTDGDGDELFLPSPVERAIWARFSADYEGCEPDRCRAFQTGECFFYNARRAAEASHLVIVNHALLLADIAVQNRALPEYRCLIVDEAHHLESATTSGLSFAVDQITLHRQLEEAGQVYQTGRVTGIISEILGACQQADLPRDVVDRVEVFVGKTGMATSRAIDQLDVFFDRLGDFVAEQRVGHQSQYSFRMRVTTGLRVQPSWDGVEIAWDDANTPLGAVVDGLKRLAAGLDDLIDLDMPNAEDLQAQTLSVARRLGEAQGHLNQMITQPSRRQIYWLDARPGETKFTLHAAPLHVGSLVEEHLFNKKECVILTSATLRTDGSFDYIRERLNAWETDELAVGSPF
ncbi:MAG: DEAD/DEAH box helicase, partial [Anaerolineae bacterium]|nr:DEAD/DEAH box helicase [Anaerolineae bacterium]